MGVVGLENEMKTLLSPKLALKLPLTIVGFCALVTAVLVTISDWRYREIALHNVEEHFQSLVLARELKLQNWLQSLNADILSLAVVPSTATAMEWLSTTWKSSEGDPRQALMQAYVTDNPYPPGERQRLEKAEGAIRLPHASWPVSSGFQFDPEQQRLL